MKQMIVCLLFVIVLLVAGCSKSKSDAKIPSSTPNTQFVGNVSEFHGNSHIPIPTLNKSTHDYSCPAPWVASGGWDSKTGDPSLAIGVWCLPKYSIGSNGIVTDCVDGDLSWKPVDGNCREVDKPKPSHESEVYAELWRVCKAKKLTYRVACGKADNINCVAIARNSSGQTMALSDLFNNSGPTAAAESLLRRLNGKSDFDGFDTGEVRP